MKHNKHIIAGGQRGGRINTHIIVGNQRGGGLRHNVYISASSPTRRLNESRHRKHETYGITFHSTYKEGIDVNRLAETEDHTSELGSPKQETTKYGRKRYAHTNPKTYDTLAARGLISHKTTCHCWRHNTAGGSGITRTWSLAANAAVKAGTTLAANAAIESVTRHTLSLARTCRSNQSTNVHCRS